MRTKATLKRLTKWSAILTTIFSKDLNCRSLKVSNLSLILLLKNSSKFKLYLKPVDLLDQLVANFLMNIY